MSLEAAQRAFDHGDFREARRLARPLASDGDEKVRSAAHTLLERTSIDPLIAWLSGACLLFFALVIWLSLRS